MRRSSAITPLGGGTNELLIETLAMMAYPVHAAGKYPHHWRKIRSILRHYRASGNTIEALAPIVAPRLEQRTAS